MSTLLSRITIDPDICHRKPAIIAALEQSSLVPSTAQPFGPWVELERTRPDVFGPCP